MNANNKKHIDISITNVQLEDGETGCEFAVFLPQGYDYNLKRWFSYYFARIVSETVAIVP